MRKSQFKIGENGEELLAGSGRRRERQRTHSENQSLLLPVYWGPSLVRGHHSYALINTYDVLNTVLVTVFRHRGQEYKDL